MKYLLLILFFIPFSLQSKNQNHYIYLNVYVKDFGINFPFFETQKINKKAFEILSEQDEVLKKYINNFYDIKYIDVYIPNKINSFQKIIIGFKNKKKIEFKYAEFLDLHTSFCKDKQTIFPISYLNKFRNNLEPIYKDKEFDSVFVEYVVSIKLIKIIKKIGGETKNICLPFL